MSPKDDLRRAIRERLERLGANERRVESQIIVRQLAPIVAPCAMVAAYMPYADEPDIRPLLTSLREKGVILCMPKVDGLLMSMHRIDSLEDVGRNPQTKIQEPLRSDPIDESAIDIVLIPGRAFTTKGERMGRGNGGYDRWIERHRAAGGRSAMIGVCFDCQVVSDIPLDPHDQTMDMVVSPRGIMKQDRLPTREGR